MYCLVKFSIACTYVRNSHISLIIVIFGENPCEEEEEDELERVEKSFKEIEHPNHEMI